MKINWLNRTVMRGPYLALCIGNKELAAAFKATNNKYTDDNGVEQANCTTFIRNDNSGITCVVALTDKLLGLSPRDLDIMIIHEAVHVKQQYFKFIGERTPGTEQEAYTVQNITDTLLTELDRRTVFKHGKLIKIKQ